MTAHPYKRSAFLAGAATLALAVTACGNDGDMSDVIQGKSSTGTASAVSGGTTTATSAEGSWLEAGETATVRADTGFVLARSEGLVVVPTSVTVDQLAWDDADLCFDLTVTYEATEGTVSQPTAEDVEDHTAAYNIATNMIIYSDEMARHYNFDAGAIEYDSKVVLTDNKSEMDERLDAAGQAVHLTKCVDGELAREKGATSLYVMSIEGTKSNINSDYIEGEERGWKMDVPEK